VYATSMVPRAGSGSFRLVSVKANLASTARDAAFQSQTVAHTRRKPEADAQSKTACAKVVGASDS
jgi:hypothetical protein